MTHERLCADPRRAFPILCHELGLPWSMEADRYLRESNRPGRGLTTERLPGEMVGRWRQRLSADEINDACAVLARFPLAVALP